MPYFCKHDLKKRLMFIECFSSSIFLLETKFYGIITLYDDRIAIKGERVEALGVIQAWSEAKQRKEQTFR